MNFVFLSCTENYPLAFSANNTKVEYLSRGLLERGHRVSVIGRINGCDKVKSKENVQSQFGASCFIFKKGKNKILTAFRNLIKQIVCLNKVKKKGEKNILILDSGYFITFLVYVFFAKLRKYKILHIVTEWPERNTNSRLTNLINRIYLYSFGFFVDGILPISKMLEDNLEHFGKPMLKTPILASYNDNDQTIYKKAQFTYCANAGYKRIIYFVLDAFAIAKQTTDIKLVLVLYGRKLDIDEIKKHIVDMRLSECIEIKQGLSVDALMMVYRESLGLLIPLDPTSIIDRNRFSQKIAEYVSTKTLIITSPVGEVGYYFQDKVNAIFASSFTTQAYADAIEWVVSHKKDSEVIGYKGYQVGRDNFNYKKMGSDLCNFINRMK